MQTLIRLLLSSTVTIGCASVVLWEQSDLGLFATVYDKTKKDKRQNRHLKDESKHRRDFK